MTVARALPPLLCAATLAATGCGGGNKSDTSSAATTAMRSNGTATSGSRATGQPAPTGRVVPVTMQNIAFHPSAVTVRVGQTVMWRNADPVDHNVVATSGASFKSKNFGQGKSFIWTATKPGDIKYVCTLHPGMDGTISVTQ